MGCLYTLTFPNGKQYVGITASETALDRFKIHCYQVDQKAKRAKPLYRALKKFGPESVRIETLCESADWKRLCELERKTIEWLSSRAPNGYNLTDGGEGTLGWKPTFEQLEKMSAWQRGRKLSDEHKQKVSRSLLGNARKLGRKENAETRARKAKAWQNKWPQLSAQERTDKLRGFQGARRSPERADAIARSKLGVYRGAASGHVGISFAKGKWRARSKIDQRDIHLGYFESLGDAIRARRSYQEALPQGKGERAPYGC